MADTQSDWQRQRADALEAFSIPHAEAARREFRDVKRRQLDLVRTEQRTKRQAIDTMRTKYTKLSAAYLRVIGTTYAVWESHGPKGEWEEVLGAVRDDAVWDRLVERGLAPWNGGDRG